MFQVVYQEGLKGFFTLYMVATNDNERREWVDAIRRGQFTGTNDQQ
jgi:hypothetical protein